MTFLIVLVVVVLILYLLNYKVLQETKKVASDEKLDEKASILPSNEEICKDIQEMLGSNCEIQLDDDAKNSAYVFYLNKIFLSNTKRSRQNYTRVMFIAHECVHSVQNILTHKMNFALANLRNLYDIVIAIAFILGKGSWEVLMISFLLSFISFYYRMMLETDAVYRSVMVSRRYLKEKNLEEIADKYEDITSKTISGMYFSYILKVLIKQIILAALFICCNGIIFS